MRRQSPAHSRKAINGRSFSTVDEKRQAIVEFVLAMAPNKPARPSGQLGKEAIAKLPPQLRVTLHGLLDGLSEKQIAIQMKLSQHTVHDHIKRLHHRFSVNSRGELLAKFVVRHP